MDIELTAELIKKIMQQQDVMKDLDVLGVVKDLSTRRGLLNEYMAAYREKFLKN